MVAKDPDERFQRSGEVAEMLPAVEWTSKGFQDRGIVLIGRGHPAPFTASALQVRASALEINDQRSPAQLFPLVFDCSGSHRLCAVAHRHEKPRQGFAGRSWDTRRTAPSSPSASERAEIARTDRPNWDLPFDTAAQPENPLTSSGTRDRKPTMRRCRFFMKGLRAERLDSVG